jgi:ABC-type uncharacterized transport system substrate-binding protein
MVCNLFAETQSSGPFDLVIIGGGTFGQSRLRAWRASGDALAGKVTGTAIDPVMINSATELDAAFSAMERERLDAVIIQPSLPTQLVAELALTHRIPAVSFVRSVAEEGGLMSYGSDEADAYRKAAILVDKIVKGAKPPTCRSSSRQSSIW